jgi:hypothetical protein
MSCMVVREHIAPYLGESSGALVEMCLTGRAILVRRRWASEKKTDEYALTDNRIFVGHFHKA